MTDVNSLLAAIADLGRDPRGPGYLRPGFSSVELGLREWFLGEAAARCLDIEIDGNGVIWAWATPPGDGAIVTGSHLDSVPGGGAFDGPLGVTSALAALDELRADGRLHAARRPFALAVFPEEEGSNFGVACLGSRLMTGAITPEKALALKGAEGGTLADAVGAYGLDPTRMGRREDLERRIGTFLELHVEQGRALIDAGQAVAIGSSIVGHGRWKLSFTGQGNHAGTTPMAHRADPVVAASRLIGDVPELAGTHRGAVATVGRTAIHPGGTNVIASRMDVWLDVRHEAEDVVEAVVSAIGERASQRSEDTGVQVTLSRESFSPTTRFHSGLNDRLRSVLPEAPLLPTGAGHDAGILAARVPSAMLYVRNPSGVSHAPEEFCEPGDARVGARALAEVLAAELTRP